MRSEVDVDGYIDARGIRYLGKATRQEDGTWRCLADVDGALCLVEVTLTPPFGERATLSLMSNKDPVGDGRIGYEAYAKCTGGKTFDDRDMPTWDALPQRIRDAWEAAARAIRRDLEPPRPNS